MTPELFQIYALKSLVVCVGVFLAVLIGLYIRVKGGNREGLFMNSVFATAFLASGLAFALNLIARIVAA